MKLKDSLEYMIKHAELVEIHCQDTGKYHLASYKRGEADAYKRIAALINGEEQRVEMVVSVENIIFGPPILLDTDS